MSIWLRNVAPKVSHRASERPRETTHSPVAELVAAEPHSSEKTINQHPTCTKAADLEHQAYLRSLVETYRR
jgi:hypothetical protein